MSVLLPWTRKNRGVSPGIPAKRPGTVSRGPRTRLLRLFFVFLGFTALFAVARKALLDRVLTRPLPEGSKVWEVASLEHCGGLYAVARENGWALYGPSGKLTSLSDGTEEVVISGGKAYAIAGASIRGYGPDGRLFLTEASEPGEMLLPCSGLSGILAIRPAGVGFGVPWFLRVISDRGELAPSVRLPGIPAAASRAGDLLYVGLRDIASGGATLLACAEWRSGKVLWCLPLGAGHWRSIVASSGKALYATSSSAGIAGSGGEVICSFAVSGPIWTAAWEGETVIISHGTLKEPYISAFSEDGQVIWQQRVPSVSHGLAASGDTLVALCQSHVVRFSLRDGGRTSSFSTRDLPLAVGEGLILFGKGDGAYLLSLYTSLWRLP